MCLIVCSSNSVYKVFVHVDQFDLGPHLDKEKKKKKFIQSSSPTNHVLNLLVTFNILQIYPPKGIYTDYVLNTRWNTRTLMATKCPTYNQTPHSEPDYYSTTSRKKATSTISNCFFFLLFYLFHLSHMLLMIDLIFQL